MYVVVENCLKEWVVNNDSTSIRWIQNDYYYFFFSLLLINATQLLTLQYND